MAIAIKPARWDEFEWGNARWGVYTNRWENSIGKHMRLLYRGVANTNVARNTTTGRRIPTFDYQAITGLLSEKSVPSAYLPLGVIAKQDAVLITFDGVLINDHIYDFDSEKEYAVIALPVEHNDPDVGGLAFREVQLSWLPFVPSHSV